MYEPPKLNVVFCSDSNYFPHLATAVISLLETNRNLVSRVFLVLTGVSESDTQLLTSHVRETYAFNLDVISAEHISLTEHFISGHVTPAAYLRLYLGELIPESVSHILYLDSDLIITGNLSQLLKSAMSLSDSARPQMIAAVPESLDVEHLRSFGFMGDEYFDLTPAG